MKSIEICEEPKKVAWKFPCLGRDEDIGIVVLFTGEHTGTIIVGNDGWPIGAYTGTWAMDEFTPITEPMTIRFEP